MRSARLPPVAQPDTVDLLAVRVSGQDFCIEVQAVREVRAWTHVTRVPGAKPFVRGVLNMRGTVLPVIDLAARLGLAPRMVTSEKMIAGVVAIERLMPRQETTP